MSTDNTLSKCLIQKLTDHVACEVSARLSEWLRENKNVEVTQEEICKVFEVPYKPQVSGNIPTQMPNLSKYSVNTNAPKKKGGRRKKVYSEDHPRCIYKYVRGANEGKQCGSYVLMDGSIGSDVYCKACIQKQGVKKLLMSKPKPVVKPPTINGSVFPVQEEDEDEVYKINAVKIDEDTIKETKYGFILKKAGEGNYLAVSVEENGAYRDLTPAEIKIAVSIGLSVVEKDTSVNTNSNTNTTEPPMLPPSQSVQSQQPQSLQPQAQSQPVQMSIPDIPQIPQIGGNTSTDFQGLQIPSM